MGNIREGDEHLILSGKLEKIRKYEPLFGSWVVQEHIGSGSFGEVYRVTKKGPNNRFVYSAVKLVSIPTEEQYKDARITMGDNEEALEKYFDSIMEEIMNEVHLFEKLSSDSNNNILTYHDSDVFKKKDEVGWDVLIRMEYAIPLDEYLRKNQLTYQDVLILGIDLCSALEVCDSYGIMHRDIKDSNIFVSASGKFKLGDFGVAREVRKTGMASSIKGSMAYMAPEVYKGKGKYDKTVDIYSLGIVLYRLMNYQRLPLVPDYPAPVNFSDNERAFERRLSGEPLPLPLQAQDEFGKAILKACTYHPKDRYKNATEFKEELLYIYKNTPEKTLDMLVGINKSKNKKSNSQANSKNNIDLNPSAEDAFGETVSNFRNNIKNTKISIKQPSDEKNNIDSTNYDNNSKVDSIDDLAKTSINKNGSWRNNQFEYKNNPYEYNEPINKINTNKKIKIYAAIALIVFGIFITTLTLTIILSDNNNKTKPDYVNNPSIPADNNKPDEEEITPSPVEELISDFKILSPREGEKIKLENSGLNVKWEPAQGAENYKLTLTHLDSGRELIPYRVISRNEYLIPLSYFETSGQYRIVIDATKGDIKKSTLVNFSIETSAISPTSLLKKISKIEFPNTNYDMTGKQQVEVAYKAFDENNKPTTNFIDIISFIDISTIGDIKYRTVNDNGSFKLIAFYDVPLKTNKTHSLEIKTLTKEQFTINFSVKESAITTFDMLRLTEDALTPGKEVEIVYDAKDSKGNKVNSFDIINKNVQFSASLNKISVYSKNINGEYRLFAKLNEAPSIMEFSATITATVPSSGYTHKLPVLLNIQ